MYTEHHLWPDSTNKPSSQIWGIAGPALLYQKNFFVTWMCLYSLALLVTITKGVCWCISGWSLWCHTWRPQQCVRNVWVPFSETLCSRVWKTDRPWASCRAFLLTSTPFLSMVILANHRQHGWWWLTIFSYCAHFPHPYFFVNNRQAADALFW